MLDDVAAINDSLDPLPHQFNRPLDDLRVGRFAAATNQDGNRTGHLDHPVILSDIIKADPCTDITEYGSLPHAERACERVLSLPLFPAMQTEQVELVATALRDIVGRK